MGLLSASRVNRGVRARATIAILAPLLCLLAACAVFAPRYDTQLDTQASASYLNVARLLAGVELGEFADPASYAEARPRYADVLATLTLAQQRAASLPASGGSADRARDDMASLFADCRAQIVSMASIHRRVGLTVEMGVIAPVNTSCDAAARAARALR
jgi:hypothetical protein